MSLQRNLNEADLGRRLRKLERLIYNSNLNNSAIGREGLEVYDGGWIRILNGGLQVIGTATISGTLDVTGTFNASGDNNMSGTNNLSGTNHLTGPTDVAGNFEIIAGGQFKAGESVILPDGSADFGEFHIAPDGTLTAGQFELRPDGSADFGTLGIDADGTLNVRNDVNVLDGGMINVGTNMKLTPADDGGSIVFQDGSKVSSVSGTVQALSSNGTGMTAGLNTASLQSGPNGAIVAVGDDGEWVMQGGQASIQSIGNRIVATGDVDISGGLKVNSLPLAPGGSTANVYWDSSTNQLMVAV